VHSGIAAMTGTPELELDKAETDMLAQASANVLAQFDIAPDPKTQAIIGLLMACGAVYGPRVVVIRTRKSQERKEEKGEAGIYNANGLAMGTTTFSAN
jgi:hypothetical protein